jgi:hypothetical protein
MLGCPYHVRRRVKIWKYERKWKNFEKGKRRKLFLLEILAKYLGKAEKKKIQPTLDITCFIMSRKGKGGGGQR